MVGKWACTRRAAMFRTAPKLPPFTDPSRPYLGRLGRVLGLQLRQEERQGLVGGSRLVSGELANLGRVFVGRELCRGCGMLLACRWAGRWCMGGRGGGCGARGAWRLRPRAPLHICLHHPLIPVSHLGDEGGQQELVVGRVGRHLLGDGRGRGGRGRRLSWSCSSWRRSETGGGRGERASADRAGPAGANPSVCTGRTRAPSHAPPPPYPNPYPNPNPNPNPILRVTAQRPRPHPAPRSARPPRRPPQRLPRPPCAGRRWRTGRPPRR